MDGSDDGVNVLIVHATEMPFRTRGVADLAARSAIQSIHFRDEGISAIGQIWIHAEGRNGVSPNGNDPFVERCRNVHHSRIVRNDSLSLLNQPSGTGQGQRSAYIIYRCGCLSLDGLGQCHVFGSSYKNDGPLQSSAKFYKLVFGQLFGPELRSDYHGHISVGTAFGKLRRNEIGREKEVEAFAISRYPQGFQGVQVAVHRMDIRQSVHLQVHLQPFFHVQFAEREPLPSYQGAKDAGAQIMMQVNHQVGFERSQFRGQGHQSAGQIMNSVQVGVRFHEFSILRFGDETDVGQRELRTEHTHHGTAQHNVANGTETDDQDSLHVGQM